VSVTLVSVAVGASALLLILDLQRRELEDLRRRCTELERRVATLAASDNGGIVPGCDDQAAGG
jgi:hypothetical protein